MWGEGEIDFVFFLSKEKQEGHVSEGVNVRKKVKIVCVEKVCILEREQN